MSDEIPKYSKLTYCLFYLFVGLMAITLLLGLGAAITISNIILTVTLIFLACGMFSFCMFNISADYDEKEKS